MTLNDKQAAPVAQGLTLTGDQIRAAVRDARNHCAPSDSPQPADYVQAGARAILAQSAATEPLQGTQEPIARTQQAEPVEGKTKALFDLRRLPAVTINEIDGEEADGTPKTWRRPYVSRRKVEELLDAIYAAPALSASPSSLTDEQIKECLGEVRWSTNDTWCIDRIRHLLAASPADQVSSAARDVLAERRRQVTAEGWTPEHDDEDHRFGELASAAGCYALHAGDMASLSLSDPNTSPYTMWPWACAWWKPSTPRRDLVKAGALILAEIERIDRASAPKMIFDSPPCAGVARPLAPGKEQA